MIGNGDLDSAEAVVEAFGKYDVDGVMIARASLGRPWLFAQCAAALKGRLCPPEPTLQEQRDIMLQHYKLVVDRFGEQRGTVLMRKYACCYAQGKFGARFSGDMLLKSSRLKNSIKWSTTISLWISPKQRDRMQFKRFDIYLDRYKT